MADAWVGPILGLFGTLFVGLMTFVGTVYVARSRSKQDTPFELLKQYKIMVDTLRDDLKSARNDLIAARTEANDLRAEVGSLRKEIASARQENEALRHELDEFRQMKAAGFGQ